MEVEYEITGDDLFAFQLRAIKKSPLVKRARRKAGSYWFLAVLIISLLPAIGADGFMISRTNFTFLAVVFPVGTLIYLLIERRNTRRAILELVKQEKPNKGQLGVHQLEINEVELVERTVVGESRTNWAGVNRVEQNDEYIFIYTSLVGAHVIPKRAFTDAQEAENFYQLARISYESAA